MTLRRPRMLRELLFAILFLTAVSAWADTPTGRFGAGIMIGEPTGFTLKKWIGGRNAIDIGIAWSFSHRASLQIHADYLWHDFGAISSEERFALHYGVGGRVKAGGDSRLGIRGVVGISYFFHNAPVDAFLEIAPVVDIAPATTADLTGALGIRYYFK
jgi:hypothetical protein